MTEAEQKALEAKELEEQTAKTAENLLKTLGLDSILARLDAVEESKKSAVLKVFVGKDLEKEVSELSADEKVKAFSNALHNGNEVAIKALSEGVDADGGYLVPDVWYGQLLEQMNSIAKFRDLVTVLPMTRKSLNLNGIVNGPDVFWTAEGARKTTTTAEFTEKVLVAHKLAAIIYMTDELMEDSSFDLSQILIARFAKKMAEAEDKAIVNGTGTLQPEGLFVASGVGARALTGGTNLDFDDIIDLIYDLPEEYRANGRLVVNGVNVKELRKLKDGNGRYLWQDAIAPGQPATISGYPVVETPWAPESQILFGDIKEAYFFGDRKRMTVKITQDETTAFFEDKTAIRVVERVGGLVAQPYAVKKITGIA